MIGFIIFSPISPEAHILSISVRNEMQSKGIGTLLLQKYARPMQSHEL